MTLTSAQKRHLRALAHPLKPVVRLGQKGVTDAVIAELASALTRHELLKVKIDGSDREATVAALCEGASAEWVQTVGNTVTLYRRNPDKPRVPVPGFNSPQP
ncbi:MAG: ribosome assembly RNA-binding protein YhbY [Pseudomonadota bacterium]